MSFNRPWRTSSVSTPYQSGSKQQQEQKPASQPAAPDMSAYKPGSAQPIQPQTQGTPYGQYTTNNYYSPLGDYGNAPVNQRPQPFTAQYTNFDGSTSDKPNYGRRDAFIQNINDSMMPYYTGESQGAPQFDTQRMWNKAGDMVDSGWKNPFAQPSQPMPSLDSYLAQYAPQQMYQPATGSTYAAAPGLGRQPSRDGVPNVDLLQTQQAAPGTGPAASSGLSVRPTATGPGDLPPYFVSSPTSKSATRYNYNPATGMYEGQLFTGERRIVSPQEVDFQTGRIRLREDADMAEPPSQPAVQYPRADDSGFIFPDPAGPRYAPIATFASQANGNWNNPRPPSPPPPGLIAANGVVPAGTPSLPPGMLY